MEKDNIKQIDFVEIFKKVKAHIKLFAISIPIAAILSYLLICSVPRYYTCTVKLAPELSSLSNQSISSLASSFGVDINMGSAGNSDAIIPELYPDLMESVDFKTNMFNVQIKTQDGKLKTSYYDYLAKHQKSAWWNKTINWIKEKIKKQKNIDNKNKINTFQLTKEQSDIANLIGNNVTCEVDKKNNVISISATDQDPLVAATISKDAMKKLQDFITEYRTRKARRDVAYNKRLWIQAKTKYEKTRRLYAAYSDANTDVTLPSVQSKIEDIENDMQLQYNTYTALSTQLQQSQAKLIEQTPAFTILQSATVPIKPAGPKRMIFALVVTGLVLILDLIYSLNKNS